MRLIDADALKVDWIVGSTSTNTECYRYVSLEQIMNTPTADIAEVPRWISVTERLPEVHEIDSFAGVYMESDPVLVYGIAEHEENAQFHVAEYCDDLNGYTYWSTELDAVTINGVTAWMPLPAPWNGGE